MKTIFTKWILAITTVVVSSMAHAIFVEPYLGYGIGTVKTTGPTELDGDTSKLVLGGRLGESFTEFWVAADFSLIMSGNYKDDTVSSNSSGSILGITAGADLPIVIPMRAWVGYGFMDTFTAKDSVANREYTGSSFKLGVGYRIIPMLNINFEYIMHSYDDWDSTTSFSTSYDSFKATTLLLSVSTTL